MGIQLKNIYITLLYDTEQFYVKKQDGGWIKICEIFPGKSLKEDLSIDTTFDPSYFSWDSTFKGSVQRKLRPRLLYIIQKLFSWRWTAENKIFTF